MVVGALAAIGLVGVVAYHTIGSRSETVVQAPSSPLDRIVIIVMENYRSDKVKPSAIVHSPFLTKLAAENRFAMNYFGVWTPSLPNYLAMIGGDFFGVGDDASSCFNPNRQQKCNGVDATNLVDQLEAAHIAWEGLFESMPGTGFLGVIFPDDTKLYAQKHNPFVYFKSIALEPTRLAKLKPFVLAELTAELADTESASRFIFLVPNQCDDQHGAPGCQSEAVTLRAGDAFLLRRYLRSSIARRSPSDRCSSSRGITQWGTKRAAVRRRVEVAFLSSPSPSTRWP